MVLRRLLVAVAAIACSGCAASTAPYVPAVRLETTSGTVETFPGNLGSAPWTVLVFFSADCPCFRVHEPRLQALRRAYGPRGVRFLLVDSEVQASARRQAALALESSMAMPLVIDANAALADALAAEYATYSVVLDARGVVQYRGGIDSDRTHLRADATLYLRDVLDDLLAGNPPRWLETKTLGCPLQTR